MDGAAIVRCVREWLRNVSSMAERAAVAQDFEDDVARFLASKEPAVRVSPIPVADDSDDHPATGAVFGAVTEFGRRLSFECEAAELLLEPLYQLACSYELAYWVLSPLAPEARDDPYAPAAALWEAGLSLAFEGRGDRMRAVVHLDP